MFKSIKNSYLLTSVIYIIIGLVLIIFPELSLKVVCYIFGSIILLFGIIKIISYFKDTGMGFLFRLDLFVGIIFSVAGGFFLLKSETVISILPVVLGIYIIMDSLMNIRQAIDLKRAGYERWRNMLLPAVIMVILAVIMVCNPFGTMALTVMFIGGVFLFRGITNLFSITFTASKIKKMKKFVEGTGPIDVEAVEVEVVDRNTY